MHPLLLQRFVLLVSNTPVDVDLPTRVQVPMKAKALDSAGTGVRGGCELSQHETLRHWLFTSVRAKLLVLIREEFLPPFSETKKVEFSTS